MNCKGTQTANIAEAPGFSLASLPTEARDYRVSTRRRRNTQGREPDTCCHHATASPADSVIFASMQSSLLQYSNPQLVC
jgi:hypothetical protein